ncbi:hypothetical protein GCM10025771_01720 [Niveibacterium umoris]|uniref:Chemotaxis protein n=1 Tax=Niveibacterium umoris TaxID=1193620 RepID=A0A840BM29_9RHOO|nr:hypothetical protein [Niveibacterium umoris]MBB4014285.1 hypothetical protein [Niveibacterium umoris]
MTDSNEHGAYRGTRAHRPDLDWSQVRETVLMLELAAGQIMAALRDSDNSVDSLAETFTGMAGYVRSLADIAGQLPDSQELAGAKQMLGYVSEQVGTMVNQAVVAFQFYDKLTQRLSHVVNGLSEVSGIIDDKRRLYVPDEWAALQERIRSKFSTAEERSLCEAVLAGMPVEEALENYLASLKRASNEIELF